MKKLYLLSVLLVMLASCKKSDNGTVGSVCATCVEQNSGYKPSDYCGTPVDVDAYISALKKDGVAVGQNWSCTKH
jgi:hypothetical protein